MSFWTASVFDLNSEEKELRCPKCSCPKLTFKDAKKCSDADMYLGREAVCYECGHEFTITGNCWETVCGCD